MNEPLSIQARALRLLWYLVSLSRWSPRTRGEARTSATVTFEALHGENVLAAVCIVLERTPYRHTARDHLHRHYFKVILRELNRHWTLRRLIDKTELSLSVTPVPDSRPFDQPSKSMGRPARRSLGTRFNRLDTLNYLLETRVGLLLREISDSGPETGTSDRKRSQNP